MKHITVCLLAATLLACEGPAGPDGFNSLVDITDEPVGTNCTTGGVRIASGIDANSNNTLDASEVSQTRYVCNGPAGVDGTNGTSGGPDEQRPFTLLGIGTSGVTTVADVLATYEFFSVSNYTAYDSAVLIVRNVILSKMEGAPAELPEVPTTEASVIMELVDLTHANTPIAGTTLTMQNGGEYVTENFFGNIPEGQINLGLSIKTTSEYYNGSAGTVTLVIARN